MANSLAYAESYINLIDRIVERESVTAILENNNPLNVKMGSLSDGKVYLQNVELKGLGGYSSLDAAVPNSGYTPRPVGIGWDEYTIDIKRSSSMTIDILDLSEAQQTILNLAAIYTRDLVVPEIDAYRFAKIATLKLTADATGNLDFDSVLAAIDTGVGVLNNNKVPKTNRVIFMSASCYNNAFKKTAEVINTRIVTDGKTTIDRDITVIDGMPVIEVPDDRFYSRIDLLDGKSGGQLDGGYVEADASKDINFMIIQKNAVIPVVKYINPKIIPNEQNMWGEGVFWSYMIYHDLVIPQKQLPCVYVHTKP
jgi:hypothetical protein